VIGSGKTRSRPISDIRRKEIASAKLPFGSARVRRGGAGGKCRCPSLLGSLALARKATSNLSSHVLKKLRQTTVVEPKQATHAVQRQRSKEVRVPHQFKGGWILKVPIDRIATVDGKPRGEEHSGHKIHLRSTTTRTQRLALVSQACLMLRHASADESAAFVGSRFDPDWGPVAGVGSCTSNPAALLRAAWA
jgi:hypothetical protein